MNKTLMIISLVFISLLALGAVSAADNSTDVAMAEDADEVQAIEDDFEVEELQTDYDDEVISEDGEEEPIEFNVTVNDTHYDDDVNVEVAVKNYNASKNYNSTVVNFMVDGSLVGNTTLNNIGKGSFIIPAGKYEVGSYYIMASAGTFNNANGALFKIIKSNPIVNVENVTAKAGEVVTIPFNVTNSRGKGISGDVIITIYWQEDSLSKHVRIVDGSAKASFNLSELIGIFGGNGTFNISDLFGGNGTSFNISSLIGGNGTLDISSFLNGTSNFTVGNSSFDISSLLNGTFSIGNGSFNISGIFNGTTPITIGNTTLDFSGLFNRTNADSNDKLGAADVFGSDNKLGANGTSFDISSFLNGNSTFDFGSLLGGNGTFSIGNSSFDLSSLLNGTFSIGNSSFDIAGILNGTTNMSFGNTTFDFSSLMNGTNGSFDISSILKMLLGGGDNTFAYLFTPGTYKISVTYLTSRNYNEFTNDTARLIITPSNVTFPLTTDLTCGDMSVSAVNAGVDGMIGKYLTITLKDVLGDAVVNKTVKIGLNGKEYDLITDENGTAKLQINIAKAGVYTASVCFLGDNIYTGSFKVVKITVKKQTAKLTPAKKTYKFKAKAKTKKIAAKFKSSKGKAIKGKKITFKVKGRTYKAFTNKKGVATVKVKLTKKGKHTVAVKFAGDDTYKAVSTKIKLVLK